MLINAERDFGGLEETLRVLLEAGECLQRQFIKDAREFKKAVALAVSTILRKLSSYKANIFCGNTIPPEI